MPITHQVSPPGSSLYCHLSLLNIIAGAVTLMCPQNAAFTPCQLGFLGPNCETIRMKGWQDYYGLACACSKLFISPEKISGICFQQSATPNIYFPNTFKPQLNQLRIKNPDLRVCRCRLRRCRCAGTAWTRSATRTRWARGRPSAGPSTRPSATPGTEHPAVFLTFNYCCREEALV